MQIMEAAITLLPFPWHVGSERIQISNFLLVLRFFSPMAIFTLHLCVALLRGKSLVVEILTVSTVDSVEQ